jgi:hypothetical protein
MDFSSHKVTVLDKIRQSYRDKFGKDIAESTLQNLVKLQFKLAKKDLLNGEDTRINYIGSFKHSDKVKEYINKNFRTTP